jgi:hypothetical protein
MENIVAFLQNIGKIALPSFDERLLDLGTLTPGEG